MRLPAPTIRLRLTLAYGGVFLVSAAALLAFAYVLVDHQYTGSFFIHISSGSSSAHSSHGGPVPVRSSGPGAPTSPVVAAAASSAKDAAQRQADAALHRLFVDFAIALAFMAVLSLWVGWMIAGRALRPLRTITDTTRDISASSLHRRLALKGPDDELKQLGGTIDGLLSRLEASFEAQRQFVANASHELRTPLTFERTLLELALSDPDASIDSFRSTCEQLLAVGEQQERLIEALLILSRSQRGLDSHQPVDLAAITAAAIAGTDHDGLGLETALAPAHTTGNPRLVERLVANLIGNAIQHNTDGGDIRLATETCNGHAVLTVTNTGPKVPAAELERLFQPFQRLDPNRGNGAGLGLGLSIVRAIADAHGATIRTNAPADGGLSIQISFAVASRSSSAAGRCAAPVFRNDA